MLGSQFFIMIIRKMQCVMVLSTARVTVQKLTLQTVLLHFKSVATAGRWPIGDGCLKGEKAEPPYSTYLSLCVGTGGLSPSW